MHADNHITKMDSVLKKIYYSKNGGAYQSFERFVLASRSAGLTALSHSRRRPHIFRHFRFHGPNRCLGMDAMHISKAGRPRIRYAYVGENLVTRKCALFFTARLTAQKACLALLHFISALDIDVERHPLLITDRGSELRSQAFKEVLKKHNFNHYYPSRLSSSHVSSVERLIRTLRGIAHKILRTPLDVSGRRRLTFCDALEQAATIYNSTPNVTGWAPNEIRSQGDYLDYIWKRERERAQMLDRYLARQPRGALLPSQPGLGVGSLVRKALGGLDWDGELRPHSFRKEHASPKFSTTLFRVSGTRSTSPLISYRLTTLDGRPVPGSFTVDQLLPIPFKS